MLYSKYSKTLTATKKGAIPWKTWIQFNSIFYMNIATMHCFSVSKKTLRWELQLYYWFPQQRILSPWWLQWLFWPLWGDRKWIYHNCKNQGGINTANMIPTEKCVPVAGIVSRYNRN